jgi:flavin reductase (DIM6/NTAB) family NADH-FMN oxidoreductase RutF
MINYESFFELSYGLYIVSSGDRQKGNGFICNTVFQVSAEPPKFAVCCSKDNYSAWIIENTGAFAVSVLNQDTPAEIIGHFGFRSGRNFDKIYGMAVKYGKTRVPVILNDCIAFFECKTEQTIDVGTHLIFIGKVVQAEIIDNTKEPLTYLYYRKVRKGFAPKNAPTYIDMSKLGKNLPRSSEPKGKNPDG